MDWGDILPVLIPTIIAAIPGTIIAVIAFRKLPGENKKTDADITKTGADVRKTEAETKSIYAQVADRWAEHVQELQEQVKKLELQGECDRSEITGLRLDIQQVRRENEKYRQELEERDAIIDDLRDWAERLVHQIESEFKGVPVKMRERKTISGGK